MPLTPRWAIGNIGKRVNRSSSLPAEMGFQGTRHSTRRTALRPDSPQRGKSGMLPTTVRLFLRGFYLRFVFWQKLGTLGLLKKPFSGLSRRTWQKLASRKRTGIRELRIVQSAGTGDWATKAGFFNSPTLPAFPQGRKWRQLPFSARIPGKTRDAIHTLGGGGGGSGAPGRESSPQISQIFAD